MREQRTIDNRKKWWQIAALFSLAFVVLAIRAWGFKDRVLGLEEGERYFALCAQAGEEISLWGYRLRELSWVAGSMLFSVTVTWWLLGLGGAGLTICLLGICPNDWWILLLTVAWTVAIAWVRMLPVRDKLNPMIFRVVLLCGSATFLILRVFDTLGEVRTNEAQQAKMEETLLFLESADAQMFLYNQPRYEELFNYYLDKYELIWHEEADLSKIEPEYVYMIYEEGEWFTDRVVKEYGFTKTDLGTLWFADLEDSLHLIQIQWGRYSAQMRSQEAARRIASQALDSALIPMLPMDNFREGDFQLFLASKRGNLGEIRYTCEQLVGALEYILTNTQTLQTVYVGLNQDRMGQEQNWNDLVAVIQMYPETRFQVILASPQLDTLIAEGGLDKWQKTLTQVVTKLGGESNVEMAYVGDIDWLFINKSNFTLEGGYTDEVAANIAANALMSKLYPIGLDNLKQHVEQQTDLVMAYKAGDYQFETKADKTILFLGDSIFGYTQGSVSIPGVVENFLGAKSYNLGYGGLTATTTESKNLGAWQLLQGALTGDVKANNLEKNQYLCQQIELLHQDGVWEDAGDGQDLVFVLNFGLNDYFSGMPLGTLDDTETDSYLGAMRKVIETLRAKFPNATIVTLTQNLVVEFEYGTLETGSGGWVLQDFREAITSLSEKLGVHCIQINEELDLTKDNWQSYLADGTHPNFYGNFCYGLTISKYLEQVLQ